MTDIQFLTLNDDFTINSIIYPTNIQWNRQYYTAGTFSIQLPQEQYNNDMKYVYTKDRPEVGMVSQVNYSIDSSGFKAVQISGYFLEHELNDKVIFPQFIGLGNVEDVITSLVEQYKDDIPNLVVATSQKTGTDTDFTSVGDNLGKQASYILKLHEMSYKIDYDYINNEKVFTIWQGKDRTQSQFSENPVKFSTEFGNLKHPNVVSKETDYKNFAYVKGSIDGTDIFVEADISNGAYRKETFIDAGGIQYDKDTMTEQQYRAELCNYGKQQLREQFSIINNIEFDVLEGSYIYMFDFDLGDKCDIIIKEINLMLEARIISIYEVIKSGSHTITLEFGDQIIKR